MVSGILLISLVFGLDQWTKHWVMDFFQNGGKIEQITSFFQIILTYNRGISFSLFATHESSGFWILTGIISLLILALLLWWIKDKEMRVPLALILGGALSNLYDRLTLGAVVDFLDFFWHSYHWPAFNVADSCICVGALWLGGRSFFGKGKKQNA